MPDAAHLLVRKSHRRHVASEVTFLRGLSLNRGRVHEFCGIARRRLALMAAGAMQGPVFWIHPAWMPVNLNPDGMLHLADPSRFIFIRPKRSEDLLWTMEETLRAGIVPLVVVDLPEPPGLIPVRRLQLATETGAAEGSCTPLGLILTPGTGGAPGVETRWSMTPAHGTGKQETWQLDRLRARTEPVKRWHLSGGKVGPRIDLARI